jgi:hypothetical protein
LTLKNANRDSWGAAAGRVNRLPHPWHISEPFAKATEAIEKISFSRNREALGGRVCPPSPRADCGVAVGAAFRGGTAWAKIPHGAR